MSSSGDNLNGVQFGDSANVSGGIIAGAGSWVQGNQYRGADIEDLAGLRAALSSSSISFVRPPARCRRSRCARRGSGVGAAGDE